MLRRSIAIVGFFTLLGTGTVSAQTAACGRGAIAPNTGTVVGALPDDKYEVTKTSLVTASPPNNGMVWPLGWLYETKGGGLYFSSFGTVTVQTASESPSDIIAGYKRVLAALAQPMPKDGPLFDVLTGAWPIRTLECHVGGH